MLLRCYLSTFQTFFFPTVNELYIGFQPVQLSIEQLRIFILFNFQRLNIYPPAFVRGCGFGQIHSGKEGAFERNTVEQGSTLKYSSANTFLRILSWKKYSAAKQSNALKYSDQIHSWEYWEAVIWNRDNVSPLELGRGRFFLFVRVDFFQTAPAVDGCDKKGGLRRNLRPPLYLLA